MSEPPVVKRCCVTRCPNTSVTPNVQLFKFPHTTRPYHRNKWIQVIRFRNNAKWWSPDEHSMVCSHHFVSGKPSQDCKNKDYAPSVFYNKFGRKEADSEVRSVSVKQFALEYVSLPALLTPPTARNLASEARRKAYVKLARRLHITERMARVWEARFLDYYAKQQQARALGRAAPRWLSAVDARLGPAIPPAPTAALDGAVADDDGGAIGDDGAASDDGGALSADSGDACDDDGATTTDAGSTVAGAASRDSDATTVDTGSSGVTAASTGSDADTDDCALSWWRRVWAGGLVAALCAAAQARGELCSTTLYTLVSRDRRPRVALSDLHELWVGVQRAALEQVRQAARAGDAAAAAAPPEAARVADLVLLHTDVPAQRLLDDESVTLYEEAAALHALWQQVQRHALEEGGEGLRLARRWSRVHRDYCASGRRASLVVLQRRWHELKLQARRRLAAHWRRPLPAPAPASAPLSPLPAPIHLAMLKRYPHIATAPLRSWRDLVRARLVLRQPLPEQLLSDNSADEMDSELCPASPADTPASPAGPADTPASPADTPASPADTLASPAGSPARPADTPASPADTLASPAGPPAADAPVGLADAYMVYEYTLTSHEPSAASIQQSPPEPPDIKPNVPSPLNTAHASTQQSPEPADSKPALPAPRPIAAAALKHEDSDTDTEDNLVIDESSSKQLSVLKPEQFDGTVAGDADTEDTLQVLQQIDPTVVTTEILFDSDGDDSEPCVEDANVESGVTPQTGVPSISSRLVFDDDDDMSLDDVTPAGDVTGDAGDTPAIDPKLLLQARVRLVRLEDMPRRSRAALKREPPRDAPCDVPRDAPCDVPRDAPCDAPHSGRKKARSRAATSLHWVEPADAQAGWPPAGWPPAPPAPGGGEEGGGEALRRVLLSDIEQVRRRNQLLLTAQVKPIPATTAPPAADQPADENPDEPADENLDENPDEPADENLDENPDDDPTDEALVLPNAAQLSHALVRLSAAASAQQLVDAPYCCAARRHRAVNDARHRIGLPPLDLHKHRAACACCCARLCGGAARAALRRRLRALLRLLRRMRHAGAVEPTSKKNSKNASSSGTLAKDTKSPKSKSNPTSQSKSTSGSQSKLSSASKSKSTPDDKSKSTPASKSKLSADEKSKSTLASKSKSTADDKSKSTPASKLKSEPDDKSKSTPSSKLKSDPDNKSKSTPSSKLKSKPDDKSKSTPSSKLKSDPDDKSKTTRVRNSKSDPNDKSKSSPDDKLKSNPRTESNIYADPAYDEWLRQKSVNTQYFNFPPPVDSSKRKKKALLALPAPPASTASPAPPAAACSATVWASPTLVVEPLRVGASPVSQPAAAGASSVSQPLGAGASLVSQPARALSILEEYSRSLAASPAQPPAQPTQDDGDRTTILVALSVPRAAAGEALDSLARSLRAAQRRRGLMSLAQPAPAADVIEIPDDEPAPCPPPAWPPAPACPPPVGCLPPGAPGDHPACQPAMYANPLAMVDIMVELSQAAKDKTEELYVHKRDAVRVSARRVRCGAALLRADAARLPRVLRAAGRTYLLASEAALGVQRAAYWTLDEFAAAQRVVFDDGRADGVPDAHKCLRRHQFHVVTAVCDAAALREAVRSGARVLALDVLRARRHELALAERVAAGRAVYVARALGALPGDELYGVEFELDAEGDACGAQYAARHTRRYRPPGDVTRTAGDVMRAAGDVTRAAGDVTRAAGDVTRAAGDVTAPDGDAPDTHSTAQ